jgi:hypothetical protein
MSLIKGKIYKIIALQGNECYVGSTFNTLRDRWYKHKQHYNELKNGNLSSSVTSSILFDKYGYDNCKIVLIKEYSVIDRAHLEVYESLWIFKLKSINKIIPFTTEWLRKEQKRKYYEEHREEMNENRRKKRLENGDEIRAKAREKYAKNREMVLKRSNQYREKNREIINAQKREHYKNNVERLTEKQRQYRENNKEAIAEKKEKYGSEKIECSICNCFIRRDSLLRHTKTKKHQDNLNMLAASPQATG